MLRGAWPSDRAVASCLRPLEDRGGLLRAFLHPVRCLLLPATAEPPDHAEGECEGGGCNDRAGDLPTVPGMAPDGGVAPELEDELESLERAVIMDDNKTEGLQEARIQHAELLECLRVVDYS
ncbi:hypothetical protein NDU88_004504 [Pleurodeles waltl]|uniref:Uncharacterized protein n=1 Tax=Pleurodeles waltl TaxID=8319 RepID=A0AAV7MTQ5_PLEWA|nr:hypothetical protein NDU88_004504 [Pleurodeles waltl]